MRIKLIVFTFLVLCLSSSAHSQDGVKVGVLASLSGNWAEIGRNLQQGITLAGEELNEKGGVLGKNISYDFEDTDEEKSGAKVVTAYRALQQRGIRLFIGPTGVPGIMALTPLAARDDMVLVAPTSTNSFYKSSDKFFNASGDNYVTTKAAAVRAFTKGSRQAAIFGSLQPWELDQAKIFRSEFTILGGSIVAEELPASDQTDLRLEASRLMRAKPDTVFFAIFNNVGIAAKQLRQLRFSGATYSSLLDDAHIAVSSGALEGTELYLFSPPSEEFKTKFVKRFGNQPGVFADSAYDAALSLGLAINSAASSEPVKVISALHNLKFKGSSGRVVSFDKDGLLDREIVLHQVLGGKLLPVQ